MLLCGIVLTVYTKSRRSDQKENRKGVILSGMGVGGEHGGEFVSWLVCLLVGR